MKNVLLAGLALLWLQMGCHKPEPVAVQKGVVLANRYYSFPINIEVYSTAGDYNNRTNAVYSGIVPGNGYLVVGENVLARGTKYYCDVYSADQLYSNWIDGYWEQFTTSSALPADTITVSCNYKPQQYIFLGATATETHWVAVDRYRWHFSDWALLSEGERYKEVTIRRDMTGTIKSMDALNNVTVTDIKSMEPYITPGSGATMGVAGLFLVDESGNGNKYKMINSPISPLDNPTNRASADTVIFEDNFGYWAMVRR